MLYSMFFFREGQTYMYPNLVVLSQVTDDLSKHYIIVLNLSANFASHTTPSNQLHNLSVIY